MIFELTPKLNGQPLASEIKVPFNGTRREAYERAKNLLAGLVDLFGKKKFTVRIDRTDAKANGYEIDVTGGTV